MPVIRILPDLSPDDAAALEAAADADGGTFVRVAQTDGKVTLTVSLPLAEPAEPAPPAGTAEFPWMPIARAERGIDRAANPLRVEQYLETTGVGPESDGVPWCSAFVNFCVTRAGLRGTNSPLARSWLDWGVPSADFRPGCIVVLSRGAPPHGHVGFFVGVEAGHVRLLGGNQHNAVNIAGFSLDRVIGRRLPHNP